MIRKIKNLIYNKIAKNKFINSMKHQIKYMRYDNKQFNAFDKIKSYSNNNFCAIEENVKNITFTMSFAAIVAKLSEIDAKTNQYELESFFAIFPPKLKPKTKLEEIYKNAVKDNIEAKYYARKIAIFFPNNKNLYQELVIALFNIALSDAPINKKEMDIIYEVSESFDLTRAEVRKVIHNYFIPSNNNPYHFLDVPKNISSSELTKHYREFVKSCHPDSFILNNDIAEEYRNLLNEKFSKATDAYKEIKKKQSKMLS